MSEGDNNSIHTALRESEEELGLDLDKVDVWGSMLPLPYKVLYLQLFIFVWISEMETVMLGSRIYAHLVLYYNLADVIQLQYIVVDAALLC